MLLTPMLSYIDLGNQADHLLELERVTLQNQVEVSDELDTFNSLFSRDEADTSSIHLTTPKNLVLIDDTLRKLKTRSLGPNAHQNIDAVQNVVNYSALQHVVTQLKVEKNPTKSRLLALEFMELMKEQRLLMELHLRRLPDDKKERISALNASTQKTGRAFLIGALALPLIFSYLIYLFFRIEKKYLGASPDQLIDEIQKLIDGRFDVSPVLPSNKDLHGAIQKLRHHLQHTSEQLLQSFNALSIQGITGEQIKNQNLLGRWGEVAEAYNQMAFEIRLRVLGTIRIINSVAQGEQKESVMTLAKGDFKTLQDSLSEMIKTFQKNIKNSLNETWIRTELVRFLDGFQNTKTMQEGCTFLLRHLESLLHFEHGIVWTVAMIDGEEVITPRTRMTHGTKNENDTHASRAQGLLHKCIAQRSILTLHNLPEDYVKIGSGLGYARPHSLTLIPICYNNRVLALVEIASLQPIQPLHLFLCEQMSNFMGVAFNNLQTHDANVGLFDELTIKSDMIEKVSHYKSEFLATMSHELRTPMAAISGMTYLALKEQVSPKQRNYLNKINSASKHLIHILNDILDSSKIEAGKIELERSEFSLSSVFKQLESVLDVRAKEKGLSFLIHISPDVPDRLVGDALRLGQVLLNLGGNAIKFTKLGHVRIDVKSLMQGDLPNHVSLDFTISDTGIGMTPDQQKNLFQPFQQADSSISRQYGGTGLGLSISSALVTQMGGQIEVRSEQEKGSVFQFQLNLEAIAINQDPVLTDIIEATVHDDLLTTTPTTLQGKHILLVEDNELNQELICELVESVGVRVTIAQHGGQALELLSDTERTADFDLVLMDCNMPVMDGFQATQAIRKIPALAHLPIIALTANAIKGTRELVINAGMNDYLTKPLDIDQFYRAMQKWCKTTTVDLNVALANCMGNRTLLARMMGLFLKNESDFEAKFLAAQATGDVSTMVRLAHTLKGGAQTMGGAQLAKAAAALETSCQQGVHSELLAQQLKMTLDQLAFAMLTLASLHRDLLAAA
jgi:hypothetical protein